MCPLHVLESTLDRQLRGSVSINRALRMGLHDWRFHRFAVGRARRRKHEAAHRLGRHRFEHRQRAGHIVAVVLDRIGNRFADVEKRRKVHHGADPVLAQRAPHPVDVADLAFDQVAKSHGATMAGGEVVVRHGAVAGAAERLGGVAPDVAGPAGHEDRAGISGQWRNR